VFHVHCPAMSHPRSLALPLFTTEYGVAPQVHSAEWLGEGDFCMCYLINSNYVFRFAKHAEATAAMRTEVALLPIIGQQVTTRVPQIEFTGICPTSGEGVVGYRLIPGVPTTKELLIGLDKPHRVSIVAEMARFARQLHEIPITRLSGIPLQPIDPVEHLSSVIAKATDSVAPQLKADCWEYHLELLRELTSDRELYEYSPRLLHGDLSPEHFLATPDRNGIAGVIDFGDARLGDPLWDLVYILEDLGEEVLSAFIPEYTSSCEVLTIRRIQIYQQLNNVEYCHWMTLRGDDSQRSAALLTLQTQSAEVA
jgi:aminoglycoside 2''-phosphotransferase